MNKVQEFIFNNLGSVRIIPAENGNQTDTLFCANDVLDILGYSKNSFRKVINDHCDDVTKRNVTDSISREQMTNFIKLPDVFNLIYASKMPCAKEFKNWISYELLPSIYMNGSYTDQNHDPNFQLPNPIYDSKEIMESIDDKTNETYINDSLGETEYHFNTQQIVYDMGRLFSAMITPLYEQNRFMYNQINQLQQKVDRIEQLIVPATIEPKEK